MNSEVMLQNKEGNILTDPFAAVDQLIIATNINAATKRSVTYSCGTLPSGGVEGINFT